MNVGFCKTITTRTIGGNSFPGDRGREAWGAFIPPSTYTHTHTHKILFMRIHMGNRETEEGRPVRSTVAVLQGTQKAHLFVRPIETKIRGCARSLFPAWPLRLRAGLRTFWRPLASSLLDSSQLSHRRCPVSLMPLLPVYEAFSY